MGFPEAVWCRRRAWGHAWPCMPGSCSWSPLLGIGARNSEADQPRCPHTLWGPWPWGHFQRPDSQKPHASATVLCLGTGKLAGKVRNCRQRSLPPLTSVLRRVNFAHSSALMWELCPCEGPQPHACTVGLSVVLPCSSQGTLRSIICKLRRIYMIDPDCSISKGEAGVFKIKRLSKVPSIFTLPAPVALLGST